MLTRKRICIAGALAVGGACVVLSCGGSDDGGPMDGGVSDAGGDARRLGRDASNESALDDVGTSGEAAFDAASPPDAAEAATPADAGVDGTVDGADGSSVDAGLDVATDAAPLPPQGTNIGPGANVVFYGVTSDDRAIFSDGASLFAVSLAGTAPAMIVASFDLRSTVEIAGPDVLVWEGDTVTNSVTPLLVWTSVHGAQSLSNASVPSVFAVSADGTEVAFSDNVTTSTKDLAVAASDGSGKRTLMPTTQRESCTLAMDFATNGSLFAQYCLTPVADGGAPGAIPPTVSVFAGANFTRADLAINVQPNTEGEFLLPWSNDPTGAWVWAPLEYIVTNGELVTVADAGATPVAMNAGEGLFDSTGSYVLFRTQDGALDRASVASPTTVTQVLPPSYVAGSYGLSPDGRYLAYYHLSNPQSGRDFYVAATDGSTAWVHVLNGLGYGVFADLFTRDSQFALYATGVDANTGIGTVIARPASGMTAGITLSTSGSLVSALSGSLVVANDRAHQNAQSQTIADIRVYDAAGLAATRTLAEQAYATFALSADRTRLIYVTPQNPPGLYVMPAM